jgi:hypothetical protein
VRVRWGPGFGALVWSSGYVVLPLAGLYRPVWRYRIRELAPDLAAHLAYGSATMTVFRLLTLGRTGDG